MTSLGLSIAHWERNAAAQTVDDIKTGVDHCALCQEHHGNDCQTCPVMQRTGQMYCVGSPYIEAGRAYARLKELNRVNCPQEVIQGAWEKWRAAAEVEVNFLKSLRGALE